MNMRQRLKVLLVIEQCNPEFTSVPLVGYNFFRTIAQLADVTLVTHQRNARALEKTHPHASIVYMSEHPWVSRYSRVTAKISKINGKVNWPLYHALKYPIYAEFNYKVHQTFKDAIERGEYDIVHTLTPMMPRYPVKVIQACKSTPFVLGPVNGGVPFPKGFRETAKKENARLNFLRAVGRWLIPGYRQTYQKADRILSGSTYTLSLLAELFPDTADRLELFCENGIDRSFLESEPAAKSTDKINLLFVGRLVPYKCADIVLQAIDRLSPTLKEKVQLTIVGQGPEQTKLESLTQELNLSDRVCFTGWVPQSETLDYYRQADIFCFPSIREFGGAVVLEAMSCGLPCIVVNHGGIGEYVSEETGFKIDPISREHVTQQVAESLAALIENEDRRAKMSAMALERVKDFVWETKAQKMVAIYEELLQRPKTARSAEPVGATWNRDVADASLRG
ncbi:MAG: glycosyltransferase family 4 protein [Cyanobacteriota bacterium]|nr:glycosyltransferase family 4 protein [Cyanobacteriota bacterium]